MLGRLPDELANAPELPPESAHIWRWWCELHATRCYGETGGQPISYREIEAWSALTRQRPAPFEVEALRAVDEAYLTMPRNEAAHDD